VSPRAASIFATLLLLTACSSPSPSATNQGVVEGRDAATTPDDETGTPVPSDGSTPDTLTDATGGTPDATTDATATEASSPIDASGDASTEDTSTSIDTSVPEATPVDDGSTTLDATPPACGAPPDEPPSAPPAHAPSDAYPLIAHWEYPAAGNVVALTFDDGPNPATTNLILDTLKKHGVRATFFLNSRSRGDLFADPEAAETVNREIAEGHVIGNHTAHHYDLTTLSSADIESELATLETDVRAAVPCLPPLTLVRAPFGEPYLSGTDDAKAKVLPVVARHGVHIGWSIESLDYTSDPGDTTTWVNRVLGRIDAGRRGPILMHDTEPVTAGGLESLIEALASRGVTFVTAEKLVRDKYGKTSAELVKP
jgi:peptidoglycan/xylan/chitin deacetylase (PgdA/CDA1 family)